MIRFWRRRKDAEAERIAEVRATHLFARAGMRSFGEVARWSDEDLLAISGCGPKTLATIRRLCKEHQPSDPLVA